MAARLGLPVASKPDSQDICFAPPAITPRSSAGSNLKAMSLATSFTLTAGFWDSPRHHSVHGWAAQGTGHCNGRTAFRAPHRDIVAPRHCRAAQHAVAGALRLREVNWIGDGTLDDALAERRTVHVKVRSTQPARPASFHEQDGAVRVALPGGEAGVAAGQACVFYENGGGSARVLGGGFIDGVTG